MRIVMLIFVVLPILSCASTESPPEGRAAAHWVPTEKAKKPVNEALYVCNQAVFLNQRNFDECMEIEGYKRKTDSK